MERRGAPNRANTDVALSESYVVGLGANLGARLATLRAAALMIDGADGCRVVARSPVVETPAIGPPQPPYLNAAVRVETTRGPLELLDALLEIERALGRERRERWGPRVIDLDVLWRAAGPVATPRLVVPHPHLFERAFALGPLVAVAEPSAAVRAAADVLATLGAPPVVASLAAPLPGVERELDDGSVEIEVEPADRAEALAALAERVAVEPLRAAGAGPPARGALVVRALPRPASLVEAVLAAQAAGFSIAAVTVSHMDADVVVGRIVGDRAPPGPETARIVDVCERPGAWVVRIVRAKVSEICGPKH